jgi:hypothetical protein
LRGRWFPVGEKTDGPASFKIANNRAVTLVALPRPIVDADHDGRWDWRTAASANNPQQGVVAHRQHQSASETRGWPPSERKPEMMNEAVQPRGSPSPRRQDVGAEALGENCAATRSGVASKTPCDDTEPNLPARQRQIGQTPEITAVDSFGDCPTVRASTCFARVANRDDGDSAIVDGAFDVETGRHERRGAKASRHSVDSFMKTNASRHPNFIKMSQSQF